MEIAAWIQQSPDLVQSVMARLSAADLVRHVQGPITGFRLALPASEISIAYIFEAMDNTDDTGSLASLDDDDISSLAGTDLLWHAVRGCLTLFLSDISLADMLEDDDALVETGAPHARTVH